MGLVASAAASACMLAPAGAAADSTIGVPSLTGAIVGNTGVISQPTPYSVRSSGYLDGTPDFYASEAGFLTEVSIAHWNSADVTVKILIFQRGSGISQSVVSSPMTMFLPETPAPGVIRTQAVPGTVPIAPGDRIGLTVVSGGSTLHALNDNSSPVVAGGTFPATPPATEPAAGESYDWTSGTDNGPLIKGRVSAAPNSPETGGGSTTPGTVVQRTKPLAEGPPGGSNYKGKGKSAKLTVPINCPVPTTSTPIVTAILLGPQPCQGKITIETDFSGSASAAAAKPLGAASYDIPSGSSQNVTIPLTKLARKKLAKKGKLRAFLVLTEQVNGQPVTSGGRITVRAAKTKRKKK